MSKEINDYRNQLEKQIFDVIQKFNYNVKPYHFTNDDMINVLVKLIKEWTDVANDDPNENKKLEQNLNNDQKLPISKIINTLLTDKKIQDESLIEGVDNNDGRAGFIHGANFVLDVIKKNCLLNDFRWFKKEF